MTPREENRGRGPFVLQRTTVSHRDFVAAWAPLYEYKLELIYDRNIGKDLTPERVLALFLWKNGGPIARRKSDSIRQNYINRAAELNELSPETSAQEFLARFNHGGAIWRIFWLHLWSPDRFPIYDQHVHRAMTWIQDSCGSEIPVLDSGKIKAYLARYLPFYAEFNGIDTRLVDKALWACGKAMKPLNCGPVE